MAQLGFTFYPKDWWTSDSFFLLQPYERYIYLECLFIMYSQDGWMSNNKMIVERRLCTTIRDEVWKKITDLFSEDNGKLTHISVNSRMKKTLANRENGLKGGRPKKQEEYVDSIEKPKKPKLKTQKNPPLEIEVEIEVETEVETEVEIPPIIPQGDQLENLFPEEKKYEPSEQLKTGSEEKEKSSAKKEKEIIDCFHENCSGLPKIQVLTKARKKSINARIGDYGIEKVKEVIKLAGESKFLAGNNRNEWTADFDWILKPTNFVKILEGNYKDKDFNNGKSNNQTGTTGNNTPAQQATYNIQEAAGRLAEDFAKGNIPGVYR